MARKAREKSETGMYNVILKGKIDIFRDDDDYQEFIDKMDESKAEILGFGLVRDFVFLCIRESESEIAADLRSIVISYARYYNKKYQTEGKLFDGRFKSEPIHNDAELGNSIRLVQAVSELTGKDGYVSDHEESGDYEMIPFFAAAMGEKPIRTPRKKPVQKQQRKENTPPEKIDPPKQAEKPTRKEETTPEKIDPPKPKQKNLPSWLL